MSRFTTVLIDAIGAVCSVQLNDKKKILFWNVSNECSVSSNYSIYASFVALCIENLKDTLNGTTVYVSICL